MGSRQTGSCKAPSSLLWFSWPGTSGTVLWAGEEKRQNKSASVYFYTADPSAPLHSWQGLELSLDPPNKSLFMRHGNPPSLSTPFGLDCPGRDYFGHHKWLLHLDECKDGASRCLDTILPSYTIRNKLNNVEALISPQDLRGWDMKQRPRGGVQGMVFTGETEQNFHQHRDPRNCFWDRKTRVTSRWSRDNQSLCPEQSTTSPHI